MKITNKAHAHYDQNVKILKHHDDGTEKVDLFLVDDEIIIEASLSDIAKAEEAIVPKSRKEFYEYVQKPSTSKLHIECTIKNLIKQNKIVLKTTKEENIIALLNDPEFDKTQFLDDFRSMRDNGDFDFALTNAIYTNNNTNKRAAPQQKRRYQN